MTQRLVSATVCPFENYLPRHFHLVSRLWNSSPPSPGRKPISSLHPAQSPRSQNNWHQSPCGLDVGPLNLAISGLKMRALSSLHILPIQNIGARTEFIQTRRMQTQSSHCLTAIFMSLWQNSCSLCPQPENRRGAHSRLWFCFLATVSPGSAHIPGGSSLVITLLGNF